MRSKVKEGRNNACIAMDRKRESYKSSFECSLQGIGTKI